MDQLNLIATTTMGLEAVVAGANCYKDLDAAGNLGENALGWV